MNQLLKGMLMATVVQSLVDNVKDIPTRLWSFIKRNLRYEVVIDNQTELYDAFNEWFAVNYPNAYRSVDASFKVRYSNGNKTFTMLKQQYEDECYIVYKGKYIFITKSRDTLENASSLSNRTLHTYYLECYQGRDVIDDLLGVLTVEWNLKHSSFQGLQVIVTDKWSESRNVNISTFKTLDNIHIEGKDDLIQDIKNFQSKKALYKSMGIRLKRGYMLYGPPGTGKTALVLGIAHWLDVPIYYLNPSGFSGDDNFEEFMASVEEGSIVLIEEVDVFWKNRKSGGKTSVSFQSLLNVIDGIHSPNDVLIFMTTNEYKDFDEAFMRKGRLDYKLLVDYPSKKMVEAYLKSFYGETVVLSNYPGGRPMVDIEDICVKADSKEKAISEIEKLFI